MSLRVVQVPDPPPGADFSYTVPGEYLERITGITATLTAAPVQLGQMYAFTYDDTTGLGTFYKDGVAFGSTVNPVLPTDGTMVQVTLAGSIFGTTVYDELAMYDLVLSAADIAALYAAASANYSTYQATVMGLLPNAYYLCEPFPGDGTMVNFAGGGSDLTYQLTAPPGAQVPGLVPGGLAIRNAGDYIATGPFPPIGAGSFSIIGWIHPDPGNSGLLLCNLEDVSGNGIISFVSRNVAGQPLMEVSRVTHLSGPPLQQDFASSVGVWTNGPVADPHRQVTLTVTNDTDEVIQVPTGFVEVVTAGVYQYSWQPDLNSSAQTPGAEVTTVPIPPLILPAGYTIASDTFGIGANDQWSNVTVWWDSNIMDAQAAQSAYLFPPPVHLVYHQEPH